MGKLEKLGCPKQLDNLTNFFTGCSRENPDLAVKKPHLAVKIPEKTWIFFHGYFEFFIDVFESLWMFQVFSVFFTFFHGFSRLYAFVFGFFHGFSCFFTFFHGCMSLFSDFFHGFSRFFTLLPFQIWCDLKLLWYQLAFRIQRLLSAVAV